MKMDDNALIDFHELKLLLEDSTLLHATDMDILCPSPMRNMKPVPYSTWAGYDTVAGKWSTKPHEFLDSVFPDYCLGWFYMMTPKLAGILAQKTGSFSSGRKMVRLEDIFLTGVARSLVKSPSASRVLPLVENNPLAEVVFDCPFMSGFKNIVFNKVVLKKNNYLQLPGLWFNFKGFIELYAVAPIQFLLSDILTENSRVMSVVKYFLRR